MLWFGPKKYEFVIRDKELQRRVRERSFNYFFELFMKLGGDKFRSYITSLIAEGKLNLRFLNDYMDFLKLRDRFLYRGIDKKDYGTFLRYGNTKTEENTSDIETKKLRRLGLNPSEIIYASHDIEKAWRFVGRNPSIIVLYDEWRFKKIDDFLYVIKKGHNFKDAVGAYIIVWYR